MTTQESAIVKLYKSLPRQAPGHDIAIEKALHLTDLDKNSTLAVLNIGCGTGAQTLKLAEILPHSQIAAIDEELTYLRELDFKRGGVLGAEIQTVHASYENLPIKPGMIDLIWSEGTAHEMGFRRTLDYWNRFLKPGGYIVLSELSWLTSSRPQELENFWTSEYPEMGTVSQKISQIQRAGMVPVAHIVLPEEGWTDNYYDPLLEKTGKFLDQNKRRNGTVDIVKEIVRQMNMYSKYNSYYSYVYYVIQKMPETF